MPARATVTRAAHITRRYESWPVYNVRAQCVGIAASIVAIIVAIVLVFLL